MNLMGIRNRMGELKDWGLESNSIMKEFEFGSFKEAVEFVNKIQEISDKMEHYPVILINRNRVRITLSSLIENEVTDKDFELAKEIDKIN
jgi:4a-hydroxytetrahydrobiopterin dehydratase